MPDVVTFGVAFGHTAVAQPAWQSAGMDNQSANKCFKYFTGLSILQGFRGLSALFIRDKDLS